MIGLNTQHKLYHRRVNAVVDYVTTHLHHELSLKSLSEVAAFSEYHFHRIFKSITGETLNQFIWRTRLERAGLLLRSRPEMRITDAAYRVGFNSLAGFSRAFKRRFEIAPSRWDRQQRLLAHQPLIDSRFKTYSPAELRKYQSRFTVRIRQIPAQKIAYIRLHNPYKNVMHWHGAARHLLAWYTAEGGNVKDAKLYSIVYADRDITPEARHYFDWGIAIPDHWEAEDNVSLREMPACRVATVELNGQIADKDLIWQYLWCYWLPRSGYQAANLPMMEIHRRWPRGGEVYTKFFSECAIPLMEI
jgi:AraC family transcriptional regulator